MRGLAGLLLVVAATVVMSACGSRSTRPIVGVRMTLAVEPVSGDPAHPVTFRAHVVNAASDPIYHRSGCGGNGMGATVLDSSGMEVALVDPNGPLPLCADEWGPLPRGGSLDFAGTFDGTLYETGHVGYPSPTYPAPAGTYTVTVRFSYGTGSGEAALMVSRTATFRWQP